MAGPWNVGPIYRELVESVPYTAQVLALGGFERLDDALTGVCWALSTNPEIFDIVKGFKDIRLIKTDALGGLPALRVWFRIDTVTEKVYLEYIEAIPEDDDL